MIAAAAQSVTEDRVNSGSETPCTRGTASLCPLIEALCSRVLSATKIAASCDQRLVGQPLAGCACGKAVEPGQRMQLDVAFVQPEGELVNVARQMLRAGMMIDTD